MKLKSKIFNWLFKEQLKEIEDIKKECQTALDSCIRKNQSASHVLNEVNKLEKRLKNTVGGIGVSADINYPQFAPSWAVVCIQGKTDFIKFINLGSKEIRHISEFLNQFDRKHVNADIPRHFINTDTFLQIGK